MAYYCNKKQQQQFSLIRNNLCHHNHYLNICLLITQQNCLTSISSFGILSIKKYTKNIKFYHSLSSPYSNRKKQPTALQATIDKRLMKLWKKCVKYLVWANQANSQRKNYQNVRTIMLWVSFKTLKIPIMSEAALNAIYAMAYLILKKKNRLFIVNIVPTIFAIIVVTMKFLSDQFISIYFIKKICSQNIKKTLKLKSTCLLQVCSSLQMMFLKRFFINDYEKVLLNKIRFTYIYSIIAWMILINLLLMSFKIQEKIPLSKFEILEQLSPIKRKVKIHGKKLPQDFFLERRSQLGQENNSKIFSRKQIHTQNYPRIIPSGQRRSETRQLLIRRGNMTERVRQQSNTINLFMGIISSTRQITKSIRKHSLQLRRQNSNMLNNIENLKFELPPLLLKRQITTKF